MESIKPKNDVFINASLKNRYYNTYQQDSIGTQIIINGHEVKITKYDENEGFYTVTFADDGATETFSHEYTEAWKLG